MRCDVVMWCGVCLAGAKGNTSKAAGLTSLENVDDFFDSETESSTWPAPHQPTDLRKLTTAVVWHP
jgi:hypothetical protein